AQVLREQKKEQTEKSLLGRLGKMLEPLFEPLGIDWRGGVALVTGFVAKEIVVSTLGVLFAVEEGAESEALQQALKTSAMTPVSALAMMLFVLLYIPCIVTITTIRRETNSRKWTAFSIAYSTMLAWVVAFCVYQGGKLLGFA
ncbi:nucleoside recognition domain-containing protein, partial [Thermodesulfobacteriota bacterium]